MVITSALHAEGREFDPRSDLHFELDLQFHSKPKQWQAVLWDLSLCGLFLPTALRVFGGIHPQATLRVATLADEL